MYTIARSVTEVSPGEVIGNTARIYVQQVVHACVYLPWFRVKTERPMLIILSPPLTRLWIQAA